MWLRRLTATGKWLLAVCLVAGCTYVPASNQDEEKLLSGELKLLWGDTMGVSDEVFLEGALKPLEQLEQLELEVVPFGEFYALHYAARGDPLIEHLKQQFVADVIVFDSRMLPHLIESGYLEPLDHVALELLNIRQQWVDGIREADGEGRLYALPFARNAHALFYNRGLFDELNLPLPWDGMTWSEVVELADMFEDTPFDGLEVSSYTHMASQLGIRFFNEGAEQPEVDEAKLRSLFEWMSQIPLVTDKDGITHAPSFSQFNRGKTAMVAGALYEFEGIGFRYSMREDYYRSREDVDWDVVTYPVFDGEETAPAANTFLLGIPATSEKKQLALQLIYVLLSEEVQVRNARFGLPSVLEQEIWWNEFGTGEEAWSGIHKEAFFPNRSAGVFEPELDTFNPYKHTEIFANFDDFETFMEQLNINLADHRDKVLKAED